MSEQIALALINGKISQIPAGDTIREVGANYWQEVTYSGDIPQYVTFYSSSSFITANRTYRNDFTYSGDLLTVETLKKYASNGTTVLNTFTTTHNYSSDKYIYSSTVIT